MLAGPKDWIRRHQRPSTSTKGSPTNSSQRGVVGADLASILAKRTAKPEVRAAARAAAITKAKTQKKEKEATKASRPQGASAPKISKQAAKGGKGGR